MRAEIERRLGITALDIYGLSEVMGPGVAMECLETVDGPTIWEDHFFPEIVNPDDGTPLEDGEHGEPAVYHVDQRSTAGDPLSYPRSDSPAAGHRADHAPHGSHQRAQRRYADYPRG